MARLPSKTLFSKSWTNILCQKLKFKQMITLSMVYRKHLFWSASLSHGLFLKIPQYRNWISMLSRLKTVFLKSYAQHLAMKTLRNLMLLLILENPSVMMKEFHLFELKMVSLLSNIQYFNIIDYLLIMEELFISKSELTVSLLLKISPYHMWKKVSSQTWLLKMEELWLTLVP